MKDIKRIAVIIVSVALLLTVLVYSGYYFSHIDHDCQGECCIVCEVLEACRTCMALFGFAACISYLLRYIKDHDIGFSRDLFISIPLLSLLVDMKVKMSN